ncbi:DUF1028 domain-containing protein [candidate division TA06 bacterium]|nr:DUF1028 domain-containing protein [candidate division TA06 bacterium]
MKSLLLAISLPVLIVSAAVAGGNGNIATFSIVAYDSVAREWGVAVQSRFLAVGAVVPYARAGIGALASQAWGNTRYGPEGLEMLTRGLPADSVLKALLSADSSAQNRQAGIVDNAGRAVTFTGKLCQPWAGGIAGEGFCVQGNILAGPQVADSMAAAFVRSRGCLAQRLIAALHAGQAAGGDSRGMQSAAMLVVTEAGGYSGYNDRMIDLRVDDHPRPIEELERIFRLHQKTFGAEAYIRIAIASARQNDQARAENAFARAAEIADEFHDDPQLYNGIAWEMALNDFRLPQALELALKALALAPGDANIMDTAAEIYARMGNFKKAVELEKKALAISPNPEFKKKLGDWRKKAR